MKKIKIFVEKDAPLSTKIHIYDENNSTIAVIAIVGEVMKLL